MFMSQAPTLQSLDIDYDALPSKHVGTVASLQALTSLTVRADCKAFALVSANSHAVPPLCPHSHSRCSMRCAPSPLGWRLESNNSVFLLTEASLAYSS